MLNIKVDIATILKTIFDFLFKLAKKKKGVIALILSILAFIVRLAIKAFKCVVNIWDDHKDRERGRTNDSKPQPIDVPWVEEPSTPIEEQRKIEEQRRIEDQRKIDIARLVGGDENDVTEITPEMLASATSTNVMQNVIHHGVNLILAYEKCGKTVLSTHIGVSLAQGKRLDLFSASGDDRVVRQRVIYYDTDTGRAAMKQLHGETLMGILGNGFHLRETKLGWEGLLKDMAGQVLEHQRSEKNLTIILDCIFKYDPHEVKKLCVGVDRLCRNAHEQYECNLTVLIVNHLKTDGEVVGSKDLKRTAVTWIYLEKALTEKTNKKKGKTDNTDKERLDEVTISWGGRFSANSGITCVAKGKDEGYPGNLHFEVKPLDWSEAKKDDKRANEIKALVSMAYEDYTQEHHIQAPDGKCLEYIVNSILSQYNVTVHPETARTWIKNMERAID